VTVIGDAATVEISFMLTIENLIDCDFFVLYFKNVYTNVSD